MANRAVKRNIQTLQNELALLEGQIVISGPYGAPGSSILVNGLTGSLPTVLSGSSPNQFSSQFTVTRVQSGSYILSLKDVWPRLLACQLTLGASGSQMTSWSVQQDTGVPPRFDTTSSAGMNQVGFRLLSGSVSADGGRVLADPSGSINALTVNVSLALANSDV
jgi:hypothetical protein